MIYVKLINYVRLLLQNKKTSDNMLEINKIHCGDCLELMKDMPDKSVDMILSDLPYGTTACKWDVIIPFEQLWEQYKRVIKDNGAIVLTASQPFTSALVMSNVNNFKYALVWDKVKSSQPHLSKIQPMKRHEDILIFGKGKVIYYPQKVLKDKPRKAYGSKMTKDNDHKLGLKQLTPYLITHSFPTSIIPFSNADNTTRVHPTQKPVELFKYLIKTYTNEGDLVLDNCIGSGTTAVACKQINRNFIGIEKEQKYVDIANKRLNQCNLNNFTLSDTKQKDKVEK
jgi:site-specific DNA-methyltransferase (adenine-specific)